MLRIGYQTLTKGKNNKESVTKIVTCAGKENKKALGENEIENFRIRNSYYKENPTVQFPQVSQFPLQESELSLPIYAGFPAFPIGYLNF
jgi:hypothetical protein